MAILRRMKFVLFDIDGTLLDSGGAGMRSLNLAFEEMFSIRNAFDAISVAGKADLWIIKEGLTMHGIRSPNGIIHAFFETYIRHLKTQVHTGKGRIKKGIPEILDILKSRDDCVLGLLTGNIEEGALIKLEALYLNSYFSTGAFGSDSEDRNKLLPIAVDKLYKKSSFLIPYGDCVVIGDTPRDVYCSKPYGAFALAVATGPYSCRELSEAGADEVLEDLSDTERFMAILGVRNTVASNEKA